MRDSTHPDSAEKGTEIMSFSQYSIDFSKLEKIRFFCGTIAKCKLFCLEQGETGRKMCNSIGRKEKEMNKKIQAGTAVLAAAVIVFFSVLAGGRFLEMTAGPEAAGDDLSMEEMEGKYITYSVAHPAISYAEEYFSGKQSRVRKMAYIVYDEARQTFLKIVVPEKKIDKFDRLMRTANRSEELKKEFGEAQQSDERPIKVEGSLAAVTDAKEIDLIQEALQEAEMEDGGSIVHSALTQTKWYVLEDGYAGGLPRANLWSCAVVILLNIAVFLICALSLLRKGKKTSGSGSSVEKLMERQRVWLEPWCEEGGKKRNLQGVLFLFIPAAAMTALGFYVSGETMEVLTMYLPFGLGVGELAGLPLLLGAGLAFNPDKYLKAYQKNLRREFPNEADLDDLCEDLLGTQTQWSVLEKGKEKVRYIILGERYWLVLRQGGFVEVVDSRQTAKIETEEVSGRMLSGKVWVSYLFYSVKIKYIDSNGKKGWDKEINFNSEDTAGRFLTLARKRLEDRASEVIQ